MSEMYSKLRGQYYSMALLVLLVVLLINLLTDATIFRPGVLPDTFATLAPFALVAMATTPSILSGGGGIDIALDPCGDDVGDIGGIALAAQ